MDEREPEVQRTMRCFECRWLTADEYLTAIRCLRSGEYLDERRFSSAVFTDQGMHLAGIGVEINVV